MRTLGKYVTLSVLAAYSLFPCPDANADPPVVSGPAGGARYVGEDFTFSVSVSGGAGSPYTYQWSKGGTAPSEYLAGATLSSLALTSVQLLDAGTYACLVGEEGVRPPEPYVCSNPADLAVAEHVAIVTQPVGAAKYVGQSHSFWLVAVGGIGALHYQWRKDGTSIGTDSLVYAIPSLTCSDEGEYDCIVTDEGTDSAPSSVAVLTVNCIPVIDQQPVGGEIYVGEAHTFFISYVFEVGTLSYQWYKDSVGIPGATQSSYAVINAVPTDAGAHYVQVTDDRGTPGNPADDLVRMSITVTLVVAEHMAFTEQPVSQQLTAGDPLTLAVTVMGGLGELNYQWQKNGSDVATATLATLIIDPSQASHSGAYVCVVTDDYELILSNTVTVTVDDGLPAADGTSLALLAALMAVAGVCLSGRRSGFQPDQSGQLSLFSPAGPVRKPDLQGEDTL